MPPIWAPTGDRLAYHTLGWNGPSISAAWYHDSALLWASLWRVARRGNTVCTLLRRSFALGSTVCGMFGAACESRTSEQMIQCQWYQFFSTSTGVCNAQRFRALIALRQMFQFSSISRISFILTRTSDPRYPPQLSEVRGEDFPRKKTFRWFHVPERPCVKEHGK